MVLADGTGTPLGIHVEKATPAVVTLLELTIKSARSGDHGSKRRKPMRLIAKWGYDKNVARALMVKGDI